MTIWFQLVWGLCACGQHTGFPGGLSSKQTACDAEDAGDLGSVPGSGRFPGGRHGNPLQYFYLEYPMEEGPGGLQSTGLQTVEHE